MQSAQADFAKFQRRIHSLLAPAGHDERAAPRGTLPVTDQSAQADFV